MDLKEAFVRAMKEALSWYKINSIFEGASEENALSSGEQVNILLGFAENIKGNVIFGLTKTTAARIAALINEERDRLDGKARKELGEMARFVVELAVGKSQIAGSLVLPPSMVITGDKIFSLISQGKTTRLNFSLNGEPVHIYYHIEAARRDSVRR